MTQQNFHNELTISNYTIAASHSVTVVTVVANGFEVFISSRGKECIWIYRRFNAIESQLKMHYFSGGAFESLISSQLLKKEKYISSY